ncbi:hypothetical protein KP509_35G038300 [Ceratopteris richardii]|uniref:Uncharacterized protein n=1 Tax=Ceratopteris richardii TaxID=49495 RepID=A0A8T2QG52_CERRI|nr:hypothetical protein KP509_35G038300 [Ceratopteris richardii]
MPALRSLMPGQRKTKTESDNVRGYGECIHGLHASAMKKLSSLRDFAENSISEGTPQHAFSITSYLSPPHPFILVGGHALGGVEKLFAAQIAGNLIPQLKAAGALWL